MKFITIREEDYLRIRERFEELKNQLAELTGQDKIEKAWLDVSDVCRLLNISKRTLQYYKLRGEIPYSTIGNKTYFKAADIERLLEKSGNR